MTNNLLSTIAPWQIALIVVAALIVLLCVFFMSAATAFNKVIFSRQDKIAEYKYFTADDFGLLAEDIAVTYRGVDLYAKIYSVNPAAECESVVIFQHGFGAGSSSYMTEIAHFAEQGFAVVAADAFGCNNSAGASAIGFYAGTEAVIAAYIGVNQCDALKGKKIFLVGHSWGAYSVLTASNKIKVDGVVALSAFNKPATCICDQLKNFNSPSAKFMAVCLKSWFFIINLFRFGAKGNSNAATCVEKSGASALLIHGESDRVVPLNHSAARYAQGKNIQKIVLPDKRHNPYNTIAAEEKLKQLLSPAKFESKEEEQSFYASFDWSAATEEDEEVMTEIDNFLKSL